MSEIAAKPHWFCRYSRLADVRDGKLINRSGGQIGSYVVQECRCVLCGKLKLRTVETGS